VKEGDTSTVTHPKLAGTDVRAIWYGPENEAAASIGTFQVPE